MAIRQEMSGHAPQISVLPLSESAPPAGLTKENSRLRKGALTAAGGILAFLLICGSAAPLDLLAATFSAVSRRDTWRIKTPSPERAADSTAILEGGATTHRTFHVATPIITVALLAAPAATFQPMPFVIFNSHTGLCLQPINESIEQGVQIVQEPCSRNAAQGNTQTAAQEWIYVSVGSNLHLENALSGLCLDARGGAKNHTPVQQWTCDRITNENWEALDNPKGGGAPLKSRVSGTSSYCLDIPGGETTAGLAMQIYRCNGTVSQAWLLNPDGTLVVPKVVNLSETDARTKVSLYGFTPTSNQSSNCNSKQNGYVIEQMPGPLAYEEPNRTVNFTVCSQP